MQDTLKWYFDRCEYKLVTEQFNQFLASAPVLYPLKTQKNLWFSGVFRGNKITTVLRNRSQSYRNQSIDLQSKSMDWFLYDRNPRHERGNTPLGI